MAGNWFLYVAYIKKKTVVLFVLAALLCGGCAPTATQTGVDYLIGVSQANTLDPWRGVLMRELTEEAEKHENIRLIFTDAANNNQKQTSDIDRLIGYGVDLLIVSPCDAIGMQRAISAINEQIPVIVLDRFFEGSACTLFIGPDNEYIGQLAGEVITGLTRQTPKADAPFRVLELHGDASAPADAARAKGLSGALSGYPLIESKRVAVGGGGSDAAEDTVNALGDAVGGYDLIFAYNDAIALGAHRALQDRATRPQIISIDGFSGADGGLDLIRRGAVTELITCPTGGRDAIRFAMDILLGVSGVPKQVILRSRRVTRANVESYERSQEKSTHTYESAIRVGYVQIGQESEWRLANNHSILMAAQEFGVDLRVIDANQSLARQLEAVRTFVAAEMDVIVISPVVADGWEAVLREAKAAGIPVLLSDRKINTSGEELFDTFIGADFIEEGRLAMRWVAANVPSNQRRVRIMTLLGTAGSTPTVEREEGFSLERERYEGYAVVASATGDFSFEGGQAAIEDYLAARDWDIDVIFAHNDDMALGAAKALEAKGIQAGKDVKIVSVDGTDEARKAIAEGRLNCSIECSTHLGPPIMKAVVDWMDGRELPLRIITDAAVYTAETP